MKKHIITNGLIIAFSLMTTACGSVFTEGELATMRGVRHFECSPKLDARSCHIVRSAAHWATEEGYLTVEGPGGLTFMPPPDGVRTVFFSADVATFGHQPLIPAELVPGRVPMFEVHSNEVWMRALPGGVQVRDSELVSIIEDSIFLGGR